MGLDEADEDLRLGRRYFAGRRRSNDGGNRRPAVGGRRDLRQILDHDRGVAPARQNPLDAKLERDRITLERQGQSLSR